MRRQSCTAIADELGISAKTVYRVINNSAPVLPATREKIVAALNRNGYFTRKLTKVQKIVFDLTPQCYFNLTAIPLMQNLSHHGLNCILVNCAENRSGFEDAVAEAAVVIWGTRQEEETLAWAKSLNPDATHITVSNGGGGDIALDMDPLVSGQLAARHLHANGHSRVLAVYCERFSHCHRDRIAACCGELSMLNPKAEVIMEKLRPGEYAEQFAERLLDERLPDETSAIYCAYEYLAHAFYEELSRRNIRVPEEVSLLCCDRPNLKYLWRGPVDFVSADPSDYIQWLEYLIQNRPMMPLVNAARLQIVPRLFVNGSVRNLNPVKQL